MKRIISIVTLVSLISTVPAQATWEGLKDHITHNKAIVAFGAGLIATTAALKYATSYCAKKAADEPNADAAANYNAAKNACVFLTTAVGLYTAIMTLVGMHEAYFYLNLPYSPYRS